MALIADVRKMTARGTKHCLSLDIRDSTDADLNPEFRAELRDADNTVIRARVAAEPGDTPLSVMIKIFEAISKQHQQKTSAVNPVGKIGIIA